jgi:hypothetical protein
LKTAPKKVLVEIFLTIFIRKKKRVLTSVQKNRVFTG